MSVPSIVAYEAKWSGNESFLFVPTFGSHLHVFDAKTFKLLSSDTVV